MRIEVDSILANVFSCFHSTKESQSSITLKTCTVLGMYILFKIKYHPNIQKPQKPEKHASTYLISHHFVAEAG